jgi:hypothetical protein
MSHPFSGLPVQAATGDIARWLSQSARNVLWKTQPWTTEAQVDAPTVRAHGTTDAPLDGPIAAG